MQTPRDNQATFFDPAVQQRGAANRVLDTIAREVDFSQAEERIAATYGHGGRPACRVGALLRVIILQHLYGLSDPQAEEQLKHRLSFQKFVQLDAHEAVPDETTICRFRQRLIECGLHEQLLDLFNGHGLVLDRCVFYNCQNPVVFWKGPAGTSSRNACVIVWCTKPITAASGQRRKRGTTSSFITISSPTVIHPG